MDNSISCRNEKKPYRYKGYILLIYIIYLTDTLLFNTNADIRWREVSLYFILADGLAEYMKWFKENCIN